MRGTDQLVTARRVTYFSPRVHTGSHVNRTNPKKKIRDDMKQMKLNGPGRLILEQGINSMQQVKYAWLYSDLLQVLVMISITE